MTPVEILTKARALIEKPENWTKGRAALNADGASISVMSADAVCFCALGAVWHISGNLSWEREEVKQLCQAAQELTEKDLPYANDSTDHPTVLRMFDLAISKAKASEVRNG